MILTIIMTFRVFHHDPDELIRPQLSFIHIVPFCTLSPLPPFLCPFLGTLQPMKRRMSNNERRRPGFIGGRNS